MASGIEALPWISSIRYRAGIRYTVPPCRELFDTSATAGSSTPALLSRKLRFQLKSFTHRRLDKFYADWLRFFIKVFVNKEFDAFFVENLIGFLWFIQSHAQRGP